MIHARSIRLGLCGGTFTPSGIPIKIHNIDLYPRYIYYIYLYYIRLLFAYPTPTLICLNPTWNHILSLSYGLIFMNQMPPKLDNIHIDMENGHSVFCYSLLRLDWVIGDLTACGLRLSYWTPVKSPEISCEYLQYMIGVTMLLMYRLIHPV